MLESILGSITCLAIGGVIGYHLFLTPKRRRIPKLKRNQEVLPGYIAPDRLEIKCEDLYRDGNLRTIIRVDNNPYLLREVKGKPLISA